MINIFPTVVIGLIAAYIAYQQYRVAHAKFKLDLFQRRIEVYTESFQLLADLSEGTLEPPTKERDARYTKMFGSATFLFGSDVLTFLAELVEKVQAPPEKRDEAQRWASALLLEGQTGVSMLFHPYMDLSDWR